MIFFQLIVFVAFAQQLVSCAHSNDFVDCGPVDTACECDAEATVCTFQFYVEYVFTFAQVQQQHPLCQGSRRTGNFVQTSLGGSDVYCNEDNVCVDNSKLYSDVITVDGKTFKTVIAVNKQCPGPTLIVREGQIVAVDVHNNLSTEAISIHWHGQHQMKTNFMDGVDQITQCPILPGTSFRYIFKAGPSGTFWYHSHIGSQRAHGLFGALIVKEKEITYPFLLIDNPASHTITLMDWYERDFEDAQLPLWTFPSFIQH